MWAFFLRPRRKYTEKKPRRNSVNENSSKVRRNTSSEECWKVDMISNTQNSIVTNTEKDLKISNNRFNRYGGQAGSQTSEKNISTVWNVGQFDIGELGCGTSLV